MSDKNLCKIFIVFSQLLHNLIHGLALWSVPGDKVLEIMIFLQNLKKGRGCFTSRWGGNMFIGDRYVIIVTPLYTVH